MKALLLNQSIYDEPAVLIGILILLGITIVLLSIRFAVGIACDKKKVEKETPPKYGKVINKREETTHEWDHFQKILRPVYNYYITVEYENTTEEKSVSYDLYNDVSIGSYVSFRDKYDMPRKINESDILVTENK